MKELVNLTLIAIHIGLGNKFLANIRSVSAIVHLVRCFSDVNIIHVEDVTNLDPVQEMENVQTELILSDIEVCHKKKNKVYHHLSL